MKDFLATVIARSRCGPMLLASLFGFGQLIFGLPELLLVVISIFGVRSGWRVLRRLGEFQKPYVALLMLPAAFASVFFLKLISALWALSPSSAIDNAFNHVHFLLWPLAFYYFLDHKNNVANALFWLSVSLVVMLGWALTAQGVFPESEQATCFFAGVHNCGLLSQTLGISIILLTWGLLFRETSGWDKLVLLVGLLAAFIVLWITERRTEWIAILVCFILLVQFFVKNTKKLPYVFVAALAVASVIFAVFSFSPRFHLAYSEAQAFFSKADAAASTSSSVGSRLGQYWLAKEAIAIKPLLGWGAGIKPKHLNTEAVQLRNPYPYSHFHNQYIQVLLEVGFLGAIVCFVIVCFLFKVAIFDPMRGTRRAWAICLLLIFVLHAVRGLANHSIGYSAPNSFLVIVTAWLCSEIFRQEETA